MLVALRARLDDLGQRLLLEVGLALDGGDDVRDQVGAPLVLVEHLGPGRLDLLVESLELVVAAAAQQQGREHGRQQTAGPANRRGQGEKHGIVLLE